MDTVHGNHHLTLSVGAAQVDYRVFLVLEPVFAAE